MLTNTTQAKTSLSYKIDDLEYQPHQIMTDDEMARTTGKAIPVVLAPLLWGAAQGMTIGLSAYAATLAVSGKEFKTRDAVIAAAGGAFSGGVTGATTVTKFMLLEAGGMFFAGLAEENLLGQRKHKAGPAIDAVPTQQDLNKVLNDKNWADKHFNSIPGYSNGRYKQVFEKAIENPASWKKEMTNKCTQCH
ncbi:hypothetical protein [Akkermansia muciniphila]|nr:hypothetical protein [Akkermansia muciniphila]MSM03966.1 hypothetical protein [Escherichia coli]MZW05568.1 hypothetical protein [Escherichia coli]NAL14907.1 hypothetical protein [Escherichia coli]